MTQDTIQTEDGRTFYDMSGPDNPCLGCAVCCMHYRVSFYQGEMDSQPGGYVPSDMVVSLTPFRACMKGTEHAPGRCIALGEGGLCAIYENRPSVCREFPALMPDGTQNPECIRLQNMYGVRRE